MVVVTRNDLMERTIMALRSYARECSVPLRRNWSKEQIIEAILKGIRPKRGRKPKPIMRKPVLLPARDPVQDKSATNVAGQARSKRKHKAANTEKSDKRGAGIPVSEVSLLVRDPDTLFVYWNLSVSSAFGPADAILRIHDVSGSADEQPGRDYYDIRLSRNKGTGYLTLRQPGHQFVGELGRRSGKVLLVAARSGTAEMPAYQLLPRTKRSEMFLNRFFHTAGKARFRFQDLPVVFSGRK